MKIFSIYFHVWAIHLLSWVINQSKGLYSEQSYISILLKLGIAIEQIMSRSRPRLLPLDTHPVNQDVIVVVVAFASNPNLKIFRSGVEGCLYIVPLLVVICLVAKNETF
mmetsp:Transcript_7483/g.17164  ORF Transcript_7483/g.17164 Transcript_7483/m.17164 type:complete len:109 (-) Transcript_7483:1630-1956(-)